MVSEMIYVFQFFFSLRVQILVFADSKKKVQKHLFSWYFNFCDFGIHVYFFYRETIHIHLEIIFLQYNFLMRWNYKILQKM